MDNIVSLLQKFKGKSFLTRENRKEECKNWIHSSAVVSTAAELLLAAQNYLACYLEVFNAEGLRFFRHNNFEWKQYYWRTLMCIYYATEVLLNLSPSTLQFCVITYSILYVCHLMVNYNNAYCFKWSSIQLLLDSKSYPFFSPFFSSQLQIYDKLQRGEMSIYSLQLVWFCSFSNACCEQRSKQ